MRVLVRSQEHHGKTESISFPIPALSSAMIFILPIIIPCLNIKPEKRPTFEDIYHTLTSGDVFTDAECIRILDRAIDPASMQNKLSTAGTSSPTVKKDSAKSSKEKEVPLQGNTIQTVLCVLVALAAIIFALLGYNNTL